MDREERDRRRLGELAADLAMSVSRKAKRARLRAGLAGTPQEQKDRDAARADRRMRIRAFGR